MKGKQGYKKQQLTGHTSYAFSYTLQGTIALCLLNTSLLCFGELSTYFLEKSFGKLHMGSGWTYFTTVEQLLERVSIWKTNFFYSKMFLYLT